MLNKVRNENDYGQEACEGKMMAGEQKIITGWEKDVMKTHSGRVSILDGVKNGSLRNRN